MRAGGLGTPATRANILQTLLDREYIVRKGRDLRATVRGSALIEAIPVEDLTSPIITGQWEARLSAMADGNSAENARQAFMADAADFVATLVEAFAGAEPPEALTQRSDVPELGTCPVCGKPVRESRAVYSCDTGRKCTFVVFKKMSKRNISASMVKTMLKDGRSKSVKGFRSKKGKEFAAAISWSEEQGRVNFIFDNDRPAPAPRKTSPEGNTCPKCGRGRIIRGRAAFGCDQWRSGCDYRVSF
jgi:DNA topoisomerase-3